MFGDCTDAQAPPDWKIVRLPGSKNTHKLRGVDQCLVGTAASCQKIGGDAKVCALQGSPLILVEKKKRTFSLFPKIMPDELVCWPTGCAALELEIRDVMGAEIVSMDGTLAWSSTVNTSVSHLQPCPGGGEEGRAHDSTPGSARRSYPSRPLVRSVYDGVGT